MMTPADFELLEQYIDGTLADGDAERLRSLLRDSAEARAVLRSLATIDFGLQDIAATADADSRGSLREPIEDEHTNTILSERTAALWTSRTTKVMGALLAVAVLIIIGLSATLYFQRPSAGQPIAKITGLSGPLQWTGDGGRVDFDMRVGTELAGGTVEGLAPGSWFELQFNDGSTVMISGTSMLTFADLGQKELRLREGLLSANVVPQPKGKPMLIHTPSTLLEVLGTQFDVEASLASTKLNVTEGRVRVRRLSDGREVNVSAKHRVIAEGDGDLTPQLVPESVNHWKSQLQLRPGGYGKWLPATEQRAAAQKAIPLVPSNNPSITLNMLGIPVSRSNGPPVVVRSDSRFVVRGHLNKPAKVHFGIAVSYVNGEFAGKFRGDLDRQQPISELGEDGQFEVVYRIRDFTLDPCVRDREEELAVRPDDLVLNGVWAFTYMGGPSGLVVSEVELIPPERKVHEGK